MDERTRICVELELDGCSPTGRATLVGGDTRTFSGWVGLMAAVDRLVAGAPGPPDEPAPAGS
jgi:hypothetical protein